MGIETFQNLIELPKQKSFFNKSTLTATAGFWFSRWLINGIPGTGRNPSTSGACHNKILGAYDLPTIPVNKKMYLTELEVVSSNVQRFYIFDRLSDMGGLDGTLTTIQNINLNVGYSELVGRCDPNGLDVFWFLETYVNLGATSVTATITYTNNLNVSGNTTIVTIPATMRQGMLIPIFPNNDIAIKSIESIQLSNTTGTVGNFGVTALKIISEVDLDYFCKNYKSDFFMTGFPEIKQNACIFFGCISSVAATGLTSGSIVFSFD
jgi:hypothetical protein